MAIPSICEQVQGSVYSWSIYVVMLAAIHTVKQSSCYSNFCKRFVIIVDPYMLGSFCSNTLFGVQNYPYHYVSILHNSLCKACWFLPIAEPAYHCRRL